MTRTLRHGTSVLFFVAAAPLAFAQITPGNLVVTRVGDGVAALSNASQAVFLDQFTQAGATVNSIALPTAVSGTNLPFTNSGSATSEGALTQSADGRYLVGIGYGTAPGLASVNGTNVFGHPAYSAAKAGLLHLTKLIAVEYGKYGIRSNAVSPGTVRTQAWEDRAAANPNVFEDARRWYPLQRIANPEDVANAVGFLASPLAAAITGACLPVDCGLTAGQAELARTFSQSADY